ncbi:hypothetical protein CDCA_CDCA13G3696 [Cyanidium caldarium]|uniref:Uncharacterized protein n=1 Tax=Cyanidium caldarium TaxID=2771 RepID=A0AAV9J056_CYACA|nr:hypothetical protein CDCA_CDCA13G3696 [Cyanidium caldarium]|eukprot:ctg_777.g361
MEEDTPPNSVGELENHCAARAEFLQKVHAMSPDEVQALVEAAAATREEADGKLPREILIEGGDDVRFVDVATVEELEGTTGSSEDDAAEDESLGGDDDEAARQWRTAALAEAEATIGVSDLLAWARDQALGVYARVWLARYLRRQGRLPSPEELQQAREADAADRYPRGTFDADADDTTPDPLVHALLIDG